MLSVVASALLTSTELGWTCLPVTNAAAYFASLSATKKKSFITLLSGRDGQLHDQPGTDFKTFFFTAEN
jgi:hypothetical protein